MATKTKSKQRYSTGDEVLTAIAKQHPIVPVIQRFRKVNKLLTTYLDGNLVALEDPQGRSKLFTQWNQTMTVTGRLSSSHPNLQNIPSDREWELGNGAETLSVRDSFIAAPGRVLIAADYKQMEVRILAHYVGPGALRQAFEEGSTDIYKAIASRVFNVPAESITKEQRSSAKVCCLSSMYGAGIPRLSRTMDVSMQEAGKFKKEFNAAFPEVETWMKKVYADAERDGYVKTLTHRRRRVDLSGKGPAREEGRRHAINTIIQGTAADILKSAMVRFQRVLDCHTQAWRGEPPVLVMSIHDELIVECDPLDADVACSYLQAAMQALAPLGNEESIIAIPLELDVKIGSKWGSLKKMVSPPQH
jgi:DNA polymerase-1